jgi:membrane protein
VAQHNDADLMDRTDLRVMNWLVSRDRPQSGPGAWAINILQVGYTALRASLADRLPFLANGLTFITLLGLVPALAISFSVAKGLGFSEGLRRLILETDLIAGQREVIIQILTYVERTQVGTLGVMGLLVLVATLILTLSSVEETFNRIWGVKGTRSWLRKVTDYFSVMVVCPLLVMGALTLWAQVASNEIVQWIMGVAMVGEVASLGMRLGPVFMLTLAFIFVYLFLPNTRVPVMSAAIAGVAASLMWWGVQSLYISFQVGVAKYNAIYGGFASLPLFMVWLQLSWQVVLFGAELARAHHVVRNGILLQELTPRLSIAQLEDLAMRLMYRLAVHFHKGEPPCTLKQLSLDLGSNQAEIQRAADALCQARLLIEAGPGQQELHPARSLDTITLADVWAALRGKDAQIPHDLGKNLDVELSARLRDAVKLGRDALSQVSLLELAKASPSLACCELDEKETE